MSDETRRWRVVLVDDHPIVLAGLRALVSGSPDLMLVGEASSGIAALKLIREEVPDVAVVDISMPDVNGIAVARRITEEGLPVSFVVLTLHEGQAYVRQAMQAGIRGYVLKYAAGETLLTAIRGVLTGGFYLDAKLAGYAMRRRGTLSIRASRSGSTSTPSKEMSEREMQVLKLAALGHNNKEIAGKLDLGLKTVETYKARAVEKLGLTTRAELIRYAAGEDWFADL